MSNFLKKYIKFELAVVAFIIVVLIFSSLFGCQDKAKNNQLTATSSTKANNQKGKQPAKPLSQDFKDYWYAGEAELTSYELKQVRYGEVRDGKAVLVFVTEPFLPEVQVKANQQDDTTVSVLKLNTTKKFNTGIYPYSIMTSTFFPVENNQHAIKVVASVQEWCGQVYSQINNRDVFEVTSHSYFEGEADQKFSLKKTFLENELWAKLRIDPSTIALGEQMVVPSLEYLRLKHKPTKAYKANITTNVKSNEIITSITYPELDRTLNIIQDNSFPYSILSFNESYPDGGEVMTTTATRIKSIKSPYWKRNANKYKVLRDSLGL